MKSNPLTIIKSRYKGMFTLVAMQLKETLSLPKRKNIRSFLLKIALYLIGIAAITGVHFLLLTVLGRLGVLGAGGFLPIPIWNIIFFALILFNFLACINKVTDALYFSQDNQILLCFPVPSNHVFASKLIVFFINELMRNCFTLFPLLLALGITYGFPFYYYFWLIFVLFVLSLLPVAIASLLSIPYLYIKAFLKRFSWVSSILALSALVVLTVLIFHLMSLLPEDLEISKRWALEYFPAIRNVAASIQNIFYPLIFLSMFAFGYHPAGTENPKLMMIFVPETPWVLLSLLGIIIVLFLLSNFLAKPLYFTMASKTFEFAKPHIRHRYWKSDSYLNKLPQIAFIPNKEISFKKLRVLLSHFSLKHLSTGNKESLLQSLNAYSEEVQFTLYEGPLSAIEGPFYMFTMQEGIERLSLLQYKLRRRCRIYCPNYAKRKNIAKPSFFSFLIKELLVDFRSYESLAGNYFMFIIPPVATLVLNAIFESMKKSFAGQMYTLIFNALIISCIILATNVSMASVYSREGRANYQLRSSPINYMRTLASKMIIRAAIMTGSLIFTLVVYATHCSLNYMRMDILFFCFYFLYLGHMLWSAELDYMHPKIDLYAETGGKNAINPNEAISSALVFILAALFSAILYFLVNESVSQGFYRMLIICALFFLARVLLFFTKVRAYGTSTYEGRGE